MSADFTLGPSNSPYCSRSPREEFIDTLFRKLCVCNHVSIRLSPDSNVLHPQEKVFLLYVLIHVLTIVNLSIFFNGT